jgi:hypothetical protein
MENFINIESGIIKNSVKEIESKILILKSDLREADAKTPFTDELNKHFAGGRVGYMSGAGAKRKDRELLKTIEASKKKRELESEIKTLEKRAIKLKTGEFLIRKNGLIVKSLKNLYSRLNLLNKVIETGILQGEKLSPENLKKIKGLKTETSRTIKTRIKKY